MLWKISAEKVCGHLFLWLNCKCICWSFPFRCQIYGRKVFESFMNHAMWFTNQFTGIYALIKCPPKCLKPDTNLCFSWYITCVIMEMIRLCLFLIFDVEDLMCLPILAVWYLWILNCSQPSSPPSLIRSDSLRKAICVPRASTLKADEWDLQLQKDSCNK